MFKLKILSCVLLLIILAGCAPIMASPSPAPASPNATPAVSMAVVQSVEVQILEAESLPVNAIIRGLLMGFSAGVAGLVYVGIGRLQEILGLAPAIMVGYLALLVEAVFAMVAIKPRKENDDPPIDASSCLC